MAGFDIIARLKLAGESFTSEFKGRMDGAEREARSASSRIGSAFSGLKGAIGGAMVGIGIGAVAALAKEGLDYASSLGEVSQQLGVTTNDLQVYRFVATQVGIEQDVMDKGLAKLTLSIGQADAGSKKQAAAFRALGVDVRDASGHLRTTGDVIPLIADALEKIEDPARRAAVEVELFGKMGQKLDTLLAGGADEVNNLAKAAHEAGVVLSPEMIQNADDAADKLAAVQQVLKGNIARAVADNANAIYLLADSLMRVAQRAIQAGAAIAGAIEQRDVAAKASVLSDNPLNWDIPTMAVVGYQRKPKAQVQAEARADLLKSKAGREALWGRNLEERRNLPAARTVATQAPSLLTRNPNDRDPSLLMQGRLSVRVVSAQERRLDQQRQEILNAELADRRRVRAGALPPPAAAVSGGVGMGAGGSGGKLKASGKTDAQREAEQAAKERDRQKKADDEARQRRDERFADDVRQSEANLRFLDMRKAGLDDQAELEERLFRINQQYGDETAGQLVTRRALATLEFNSEQSLEKQKRAVADRADAERAAAQEIERLQEQEDARQRGRVDTLSGYFEAAMAGGVDGVWDAFQQQGERAIANLAAQWVLSKIGDPNSSGGFSGNPLGSLMSAVLGRKSKGIVAGDGAVDADAFMGQTLGGSSDAAGASAAAAVGIKFASDALGLKQSKLGGQLGSAAGFAIGGPAGAALGEAVGSVLGGFLKSTKKGFATFGTVNGSLGVASVGGNSSQFSAAANDAAGTVTATLQKIAESLGGNLSGNATGSLGIRHGDYRYDATGRGVTKKDKGAIDFDGDAEAAIAYAVSDLLKDGVVQGISDAQKRLLQAGGDLETAVEKATLIGEIPKLLKQRLDPVGAAVDEISKRFDNLRSVLDEAGASVEERAQAEQLYQLELDEAKRSSGGAADSLRDFLKGFQTGSSSALSLRDQETAAQAALQPYLDKIAAGGSVDNDKYLAAAQDYLDIERQLNGSTQAYFDALARVQAATNGAIANIDKVSAITPAADPLAVKTADATSATAVATQAATDILAQQTGLLKAIADAVGYNSVGGGSGFIGTGRSFVQAA